MTTAAPGSYNWTQLTDELGDGLADRMLRVPILYLGAERRDDIEDSQAEGVDLEPLLADSDQSVIDDIRGNGTEVTVRAAETGRGAGAIGIAMQFGETLATVGGAAAMLRASVQTVTWAYRRVCRSRGTRVPVSLGAAEHLAAAHLLQRVGDGTTIELIGSGDMTSRNQDRSFTGGDSFYVQFTDGDHLHHYHVTAYGEVFYIGTSPTIPPWFDAEPPRWTEPDE